MEQAGDVLLDVRDLQTQFKTSNGVVRAVDGVSWDVRAGETVALVGESGCGKSVSALSIMRLVSAPAGQILGGEILFKGRDLRKISEDEMRHVRGREIGMIFQEPMTSLNPVLTVGRQLTEPPEIHLGMTPAQSRARAIELLGMVGISDPERRLQQYPHQFSGGMRQRMMIAMSMACSPALIIADEPTTALDVTIQAQILELMKGLSRKLGVAMVMITHNLGVVARYADRVNVMYAGRIVERGTAAEIYANPRHPYTLGLLRSVPRLDEPRRAKLLPIQGQPPDLTRLPAALPVRYRPLPARSAAAGGCVARPRLGVLGLRRAQAEGDGVSVAAVTRDDRAREEPPGGGEILTVRNLSKHFEVTGGFLGGRRGVVKAVDDISFSIRRGETLGLVGESGCGKTTTGRCVLQLEKPTSGSIFFEGKDLATASPAELRAVRRKMQVIFQDPYSSLNPRMTVGQIIAEPLAVHGIVTDRAAREARVKELLGHAGLLPAMAHRYPHELSGGQRQRVGIARALAMEPSLIVCDEPVSALDVSIQAQIINLLEELQTGFGLTYLFVAHDLSVVRHISDRVAVMYLGKIVELTDRQSLYEDPQHPYTKALLSAVPIPDPAVELARERTVLRGEVPNPPACGAFHPRCPVAIAECKGGVPPLRTVRPRHLAACIRA